MVGIGQTLTKNEGEITRAPTTFGLANIPTLDP